MLLLLWCNILDTFCRSQVIQCVSSESLTSSLRTSGVWRRTAWHIGASVSDEPALSIVPWRWKQQVHSKHCHISTKLQYVTTQKTISSPTSSWILFRGTDYNNKKRERLTSKDWQKESYSYRSKHFLNSQAKWLVGALSYNHFVDSKWPSCPVMNGMHLGNWKASPSLHVPLLREDLNGGDKYRNEKDMNQASEMT
jgi:hypothetical protein